MHLVIRTTYPRVQIEYQWPRAEIEQKISQVKIKRSGPKLEIDQRQSRNDIGMGSYGNLASRIKEQSYQQVLEKIAGICAEGDEILNTVGRFEERMIFAEIEKRRERGEQRELNVQSVPRSRPKISFHFQQEIGWEHGGATIRHHIHPPKITWELGGVDIEARRADRRGE